MKYQSWVDNKVYEAVQWNGEWKTIIDWLDSISPDGRFSVPVGCAPSIQRGVAETLIIFRPDEQVVVLIGDWIVLEPPTFQSYGRTVFERHFQSIE